MRIALITDGIWPYVLGGMQKHSYYLCKYLARNKVHVDLVHFNQSAFDIGKLEFFTDQEKEFIHPRVISFPASRLRFPGHYIYDSWRYSKRVFQALKNELAGYDLIYTKGFTGWYLIDQKTSGKITCGPIGVKFHGYEMFQPPPDWKIRIQHMLLLRWPVRRLSRHADLVFSYGGKITDIVRSIGVASSRIVELPSGVEADLLVPQIRATGHDLRFLFLGRYERRKGIEELNTALRSLIASNKMTAEFHFIGPIPAERRLVHDKIVYHGEVRGKEGLQALIAKCDVLICPSWSEGMPNVILEAMANGLAVIATDVGATNVLVSDQTGWLLPGPDPILIEKTILEAVGMDKTTLDEKKRRALQTIQQRFTWELLVPRLIQILTSNSNRS